MYMPGAPDVQKMALDNLELELYVAVSLLLWVLEIKPRST